jgi:two-component sensor histidine kinase
VPLIDLVAQVIAPFDDGRNRFDVSGGPASIASRDVTNLCMCLHELCTNAVKYGSLSNEEGRVLIGWAIEGDLVALRWQEEGGPEVQPPTGRGLGTKLLNSGLFGASGGEVKVNFLPAGLVATISLRAGSPSP